MKDIEKIRIKLDKIDKKLLKLLSEREKHLVELGKEKGVAIFQE